MRDGGEPGQYETRGSVEPEWYVKRAGDWEGGGGGILETGHI